MGVPWDSSAWKDARAGLGSFFLFCSRCTTLAFIAGLSLMGGEAWLHVYIFLKTSHATFRVADARIFYVDAKQEPFSLTRNLTSQGFSYEKPSGLTREKKKRRATSC